MIPCPKCKTRTDVYDSRITVLGQLRRKRICHSCGWRFATLEVMDKENELRQLGDKPQKRTPPPKLERKVMMAKVKTEKKAKQIKQEKVRRFDDDDFEEDDRYDIPEDMRYLFSDRGFD